MIQAVKIKHRDICLEKIKVDWKKINLPAGGQVIKSHSFIYLAKGRNFQLEINEYMDGKCIGYGQISNDESQQLKPVNSNSIEGCLQELIDSIHARV